jgi:hypothetical protein
VLKKIFTGFLTVALLVLIVLPAMAQEYENDNFNIEFNYSPLNISGGSGFSSDLTMFNVKAEARIYRGLKIVASDCFANGGSGSFNGITQANVNYNDFEAYLKVPMNLASLSNDYNRGGPGVAENPFFFTIGWKNHSLTSNGQPLNKSFDWENGNGFGLGVGFDAMFEGIGIDGLVAYYPSMNASNVPNAVPGVSYSFKDLVYRAALKFKLRENIDAHIGYRGENHSYANTDINYSGVYGGVGFKF